MMLSYEYLNDTLDLDGNYVPVLIIENKKVFRKILRSFYDGTIDEMFTFSQAFTPFDFSEKGYFVPNVLDLEFQNKKLLSKINSLMYQTAINEFDAELAALRSQLLLLFDKMNQIYDYEFDSRFDVDYSSILKLFEFKIDTSLHTCAELLVSYILLLNKYLKYDLFVVHSLYNYFDSDEVEYIFKTLKLNHINILSVHSSKPEKTSPVEKLYILDCDLCFIDNADI